MKDLWKAILGLKVEDKEMAKCRFCGEPTKRYRYSSRLRRSIPECSDCAEKREQRNARGRDRRGVRHYMGRV